ncbi:type II secretion system protein M [Pseudomonas fuscovaginae UPB0736]|uniref:type II secretion system protein GspM n=1 Tax=Pseudomonas asplenii TaxID=53407 RepID=UPI000289488E|nr:type II secretion system protein GspM [Pseudomonas fuscovaginae]UUQ67168.1 type II secretion system protein M [Pseudomonas fuscovaginae UPB0736]
MIKRLPTLLIERWQRLAPRERQWLIGLGLFLLSVAMFSGLWLPSQQRLERAHHLYQQRWALAGEVHNARPMRGRTAPTQPLSTRLDESVRAAGLELQQLDQDGQTLRLTLVGDALALLGWLERVEQDGAQLQSLGLEPRDKRLEARVVWQAP